MTRRLKSEVLPNLTKQRQFIPIEPKFKKDYRDIEKRLFAPEEGDSYMALAMTGRQLLSQYKLDTAIELADTLLNADESVVIVTNFIETADKLLEYYGDQACAIRGGMSDKQKEKAKEQFQNKEKTVCVLNMQAGGVGHTLTAAHAMIIIDYAWIPSDMIQVEDRICRTGQDEHCMIYYVYCVNAIFDNLFIEMISSKSENIDLVVDGAENTFDLKSEKEKSNTFIDALKDYIKKESIIKQRQKKTA
jgi:SNF2 family DNA or RNA helicase